MELDKIGIFIKQLRKERKMSQQMLADMIPIDRSGLSRWENGEVLPPVDKMKILCEIFEISIDELLSGEKTTIDNKIDQQKKLFDYLINQDSKYRKVKTFFITSLIFIFLIIVMFLAYYFYETYNTEKIYKIYTLSDKYIIENGILMITRENSYLKIGGINNEIFSVKLFYKDSNQNIVIFEGDSDSLIVDFYGYNNAINIKNFKDIKDNFYLEIEGEEIKLYLSEYYKNDNLILKDWKENEKTQNKEEVTNNKKIPIKIEKEFKCDNNFCSKLIGKIQIDYSIEENIIYIKDDDVRIQYDILYDIFDFNYRNLSFTLEGDKLICNSDSCDGYEKMYEKYYKKIIEKYI